ncbi:hypothetical protein [uncultured Bartonella sp.]|uniref:hypothetical protein n=1 Tax=uncultured Bartonella sp. TaxID=104108 RepID=UPI0026162185|nr:hypothetical protein [uncultured Bartonella sp.]
MKLISSLIFTTACVVSGSGFAIAGELNSIQKAELNGMVAEINNAAEHKDMNFIANNMPERLFKEMARRLNMDEAALKQNFLKQLDSQFSNLPAGAYHLDADKIDYRQTSKGIPYALVPTRVETKETIAEYPTLAIIDNTKWHLIYGGQKTVQNPVFQEIYPDYQDVNIPQEKITRK